MDMLDEDVVYSNMDPRPPPLLMEQQQQQEGVDLDRQFGNILSRLMDGQISAQDAIVELQQHTADVVQYYRAEAGDELAPAARRINISKMASELEGQAASWQLLHSLYCSDGMPAGVYEGAPNVGERLTVRQLLADTVNSDDQLKRFAQVVMWLESLAAQQLPQDPVQLASTYRFGSQEGVWKSTLRGQQAAGSRSAAAAELDPDAVSRDQLIMAEGDKQNEQRLAAWAWRLVCAGRFKEACELCYNAGQPWRAVSLSGAGPWGPLPVGDAAIKASTPSEQQGDMQDPSEEVSCEVEAGAATARLAWRWACCAAAAAAAGPSGAGESGNKYEAALYGALCGDVRAMLPACDSWEDEAWAYCRSYMELAADAALLQGCRGSNLDPQAQAAAQGFYLGHAGDSSDAEIPVDMLEGLVDLAAASGYTKAPKKHLLREGLAVMSGDWPLQRLAAVGDQHLLPTNFKDLYDLLASSSNTAVSNAAGQPQHLVQSQLMQEAWVDLVSQLNSSSTRAAAQLQELQGKQAQGLQGRMGWGTDGDSSMDGPDADGMGVDWDDGGASAVSVGAASDVLRFNAHMALALRALGKLPDALKEEDETDTLPMLQAVCSQVICRYASQLASEPSTLTLVPAYICHLRLPERRQLMGCLVSTALEKGVDESQCEYLYSILDTGTQFWFDRQTRQQQQQMQDEEEEADPYKNQLFGDLRPEEARLLLQHIVYTSFSAAATTPKQRCDTLRWLFYGFLAAAGSADDTQQQLTWQGSWSDALSNALSLATQLALNPGFGGVGLTYLLQEVVPAEFTELARQAAAAAAAALDDDSALSFGSVVSQAVGMDVVQPVGQLQVQRQLLALTFWQHYAALEGRYLSWKQARNSLVTGAHDQAAGISLDESVSLVQDMLHLVHADLLRLPGSSDLAELLRSMQQPPAAAGGTTAAAAAAAATADIDESSWLCEPQYDPLVDPLLLALYAEGSVEQVLGLMAFSELQLAVTVSRHQPGLSQAADTHDIDAQYSTLQAHELPLLQARVEAFLQGATAAHPDVSFSTGTPGADEPLAGCLLVRLKCFSSSSSDGSSRVQQGSDHQARELTAWLKMVDVAVGLLDAGSRRGTGAGGSEDNDEEGEGGVPRLSVVFLNSSLSTQLAISRRRTTSKLLRRSAKVLAVLTRQGYRGGELDSLLDLASHDGLIGSQDEGRGLLSQLSQGDAAALLDTLTEALAEVQDGV